MMDQYGGNEVHGVNPFDGAAATEEEGDDAAQDEEQAKYPCEGEHGALWGGKTKHGDGNHEQAVNDETSLGTFQHIYSFISVVNSLSNKALCMGSRLE